MKNLPTLLNDSSFAVQFSNSVSKTRAILLFMIKTIEMFELHASMPPMRSAEYQATIPLKFLIITHNYAKVETINQSKSLPGFRVVVTSLDGINSWSIQMLVRENNSKQSDEIQASKNLFCGVFRRFVSQNIVAITGTLRLNRFTLLYVFNWYVRTEFLNCLLYKVLLNLHIFPALNKNCTDPYLGPFHRSYIYIYADKNSWKSSPHWSNINMSKGFQRFHTGVKFLRFQYLHYDI